MRLPRWLLVSLIAVSAIALVAVPVWLWVEMPRRTAAKFVAAIDVGDATRVNTLLTDGHFEQRAFPNLPTKHFAQIELSDGTQHVFTKRQLDIVPRGFRDILHGQQLIQLHGRRRNSSVTFRASWSGLTISVENDPDNPAVPLRGSYSIDVQMLEFRERLPRQGNQ